MQFVGCSLVATNASRRSRNLGDHVDAVNPPVSSTSAKLWCLVSTRFARRQEARVLFRPRRATALWLHGRGVVRHPEDRRVLRVASDLDGDELAQEGAEGLGILTSDRTQVLDAADRAECLKDRLLNVRGDLVGAALFGRTRRFPPRRMFENPSIFSKILSLCFVVRFWRCLVYLSFRRALHLARRTLWQPLSSPGG